MNNLVDFNVFQGKIEKYECKCQKMDMYFNKTDARCWAAVINPNKENIFVIHQVNKYEMGDASFDVLSSEKITTDIDPEDIYQTVELLLNDRQPSK